LLVLPRDLFERAQLRRMMLHELRGLSPLVGE
jgi:hypothetical protein